MKRPRRAHLRDSKRAAEKRTEDRRGYVLMAGSFGIILLFVVLALTVFRTEKVDEAGCPQDHSTPRAHTVLLVDQTDQLSNDELKYATSLIMNEYSWLPVGGRLTVRNIVSDANQSDDIVICRMQDGTGVLGIGKNKKAVQRAFDRVAGVRLKKLLDTIRIQRPQKTSPIMEFAAEAMDRPDFGKNVKKRRLVILSDMLQYSDLYSQYSTGKNPALNEDAHSELDRDMKDVAVRIHYVTRHNERSRQGKRHQQFWRRYFQSMGADVAIGHDLLIGEDPQRGTWTNAGA